MSGLTGALSGGRSIGAIVAAAALAALATSALAASFLLAGVAQRREIAARQVTIAVIAADPAEQAARARIVAAAIGRRADLRDVHPVPEDVARAEVGDGPLPALIDATLSGGGDATPLSHALAGLPGVTLVRATPIVSCWPRTLARLARIIAALALAGGIGAGVSVAMAADAPAIALLQRLGADDFRIVRALMLAGIVDLLAGGLIGTLLALPFIAWQARATEDVAMGAVPISTWAAMAAVPPILTLLGALGTAGAAAARVRRRP